MVHWKWKICQNLATPLVAKETSTFVVITFNPLIGGGHGPMVDISIETEKRQWNHEFIDGIFCPQEDELIKSIPLDRGGKWTGWIINGLGVYLSIYLFMTYLYII